MPSWFWRLLSVVVVVAGLIANKNPFEAVLLSVLMGIGAEIAEIRESKGG